MESANVPGGKLVNLYIDLFLSRIEVVPYRIILLCL